MGLGLLRDLMDRVFRTAKQLEAELQVPCVAVVPVVKNEPQENWKNKRPGDFGPVASHPLREYSP